MDEKRINRLKGELILHGVANWAELAGRLGLNKATIHNRLAGKSPFKQDELAVIGDIIGKDKMISIFFGE